MPTANAHTGYRERGAVLIVSLLFLVILTILGITAMSGTTLEHRMAGNARDYAIALEAAEAALRDAHRDVNPAPGETGRGLQVTSYGNGVVGACGSTVGMTGNKGLCLAQPQIEGASGYILPPIGPILVQPYAEYGDYTGMQKLRSVVGGAPNTLLPTQPRYWVEAMCGIEPPGETVSTGVTCGFRRITARGFGVNPATQVTLQEIYRIAIF